MTITARAGLGQQQLAGIAASFAASPREWIGQVRLNAEGRWYERARLSEGYDVWIITWLPGQATGFHDHGPSAGGGRPAALSLWLLMRRPCCVTGFSRGRQAGASWAGAAFLDRRADAVRSCSPRGFDVVHDGTREHGMRAECIRMRPHDHIGWVVDGPAGFDAVAAPFLAEGAARGELLVYVVADPDPAIPARLGLAVASHGVQVASIAEVYGPSGIVDAAGQRATFAGMLRQALADGYAGIRVAADNTPLITSEDRFAAWVRWELTADQFMAANPVTGLCVFDRHQADVGRLRHLATLHPLSPANNPRPQYRLFADDGHLRVVGHIDSFAAQQVRLALDVLPPGTSVLIDVPAAGLASRTVTAALRHLREAGIPVIIRSPNDDDAQPGPAAPGGGHLATATVSPPS